MPDNLSISIGVDTSKARADLELLNAKIRELRKEVKAASTEANASGGMTPRLSAATKELTVAEAQQKTYARAARGTAVANAEASMSFAELGKNVAAFGRASGIAVGGMKALRFGLIGLVGAQIIRGLNAITDKITEIQDLSKKTGLDPATIQQFGNAVAETGGKAEDAAAMLSKLTEPFAAEKKQEMVSWWGAANDAAGAGLPPATAYAKALNDLHINMQQFGTDAKGQHDLVVAVAKALTDMAAAGKLNDANRISSEQLGRNWREAGDALQRYVELSKTPAPATGIASPEAAQAAKDYEINVNALSTAWNELLAEFANSFIFQDIIQAIKNATAELKSFNEGVKFTLALLNELGKNLNILPQTDFGGGGDIAPGAAAGGYVSGPGTGTSDSILARLSDGEYVMRAAAVRRWGPRFMAALNAMRNPFAGFADGGAVRARGIPRFAGGGLARAGGGATVNLMFPGGSFALTADNAIVGGLTREAKRAGMLTAGRRAGLLQ